MDNLNVAPRPVNGTMILVFGIVGILCCPVFAIIAWVMGNGSLKDIDSGQADPTQRSIVATGRILGIVGCVLSLVWVPIYLIGMIKFLSAPQKTNIIAPSTFTVPLPATNSNSSSSSSSSDPLGKSIMARDAAAVNKVLDQDSTLANKKGPNGETPLFDAAFVGDKDVVAALIAHGADVNAKNDFGDTPLDKATFFKNGDVIALLKSHGAMPGTGSSPMSIRHNSQGSPGP